MGKSLTLETLPPEAKAVVKSKRISGRKKLSHWLSLLKTLSQFDKEVDEQYSMQSNRAITATVITCLCSVIVFISLMASEADKIVVAVSATIMPLLILTAIYFWIKSSALKKINLTNDFRETILPLFTLLAEDIQAGDKISLSMNLDTPARKQYQISQKKVPPGKNRKCVETVYEITCCHAEIPLVNGTVLNLEIKKIPVSIDRYYSSASGKSKHKQKWKQLTIVTGELYPSMNDFAFDEQSISAMQNTEKIKMKDKKGEPLCRLVRKFKNKSPGEPPEKTVAPEVVIEMFMTLCSMLKPAEK